MDPETTLRRRISEEGPIPFADFMAEALYGEEGYYRRRDLPIGVDGDFVTGSSWSPLFGRTTARLVRRLDEALGISADVLEVGPGNGAHLRALVEALGNSPRRILACDRVPREVPVGVRAIGEIEEAAPIRGLIFSYELFDALPVHRAVGSPTGAPREVRVGLGGDGGFAWQVMESCHPGIEAWLRHRGVQLVPGQLADVSLEWEPLYRRLARSLEEGLVVTCDYGFETAALFDPRVRRHGTLACYRGHRVHRDPFRSPGGQDITAHVDLAALREAGEAEGLVTLGLLRQAAYLTSAGIFDEIAASPGSASDAQRLLDGEGMGEEIRVLVQGRGTKGREAWIRNFEQLSKRSNGGSISV